MVYLKVNSSSLLLVDLFVVAPFLSFCTHQRHCTDAESLQGQFSRP